MALGDSIDKVAQRITVVLVSVMISVVGLNVFCRYFLGFSWAWGEEFPRYALVWITFIGGGVAVKNGQMMALNFLVEKLPKHIQRLVMVTAYLSSCAFLGVALWYGILITAATYKQASPALRFPMSYAYVIVPVGSAIMLFHMIVQVIDLLMLKEASPSGECNRTVVGIEMKDTTP